MRTRRRHPPVRSTASATARRRSSGAPNPFCQKGPGQPPAGGGTAVNAKRHARRAWFILMERETQAAASALV